MVVLNLGAQKMESFLCFGQYHATNWDECGFFCFANKRFNILYFYATLIYTTIISLLQFLFDAITKNYNNDSSLNVSINIMNGFFLRFILRNYCLGNSQIKDGIIFHNGVSHIASSVFYSVKNLITLNPMFRQRQTSSFTLELLEVIKPSKCVQHVIRQEKRCMQTKTLKAQFLRNLIVI